MRCSGTIVTDVESLAVTRTKVPISYRHGYGPLLVSSDPSGSVVSGKGLRITNFVNLVSSTASIDITVSDH